MGGAPVRNYPLIYPSLLTYYRMSDCKATVARHGLAETRCMREWAAHRGREPDAVARPDTVIKHG
eukprot:1157967-Pelagomonas_calceolata.AAC.2